MPPAPSAWADRWLAWRNRLVASPRFQRWAAGFPLTRRVAQRNTRALFDLCAGFVYAQVLTACIRLNLFAILAEGPLTVDALRGGSTFRPTRRDACCAPPSPSGCCAPCRATVSGWPTWEPRSSAIPASPP